MSSNELGQKTKNPTEPGIGYSGLSADGVTMLFGKAVEEEI